MIEVKTNQQQNIRLLAVKALSEINRNGAYANIKLQEYLQKISSVRFRSKVLLLNLCMGSFVEKIIWMP